MKTLKFLINSNIYISLAAVALTMATQVQIGMAPQWHPYLFLIFFATLFEYNLHRLITILTHSEALNAEKHKWVKGKINWFYLLVIFSLLGFAISVVEAKLKVLLTLAPLAGLTLFYSTPISKSRKEIFRLRQIPYLKIFLISFVWATVTVLLPVIHAETTVNTFHVFVIILERFLFVFAITIPFDIRDMAADSQAGLKTIPLNLGETNATRLSLASLILFFTIVLIHYTITTQYFIVLAFTISFISTALFISSKKVKSIPLYHYGILDGTMLMQGALAICIYHINFNF